MAAFTALSRGYTGKHAKRQHFAKRYSFAPDPKWFGGHPPTNLKRWEDVTGEDFGCEKLLLVFHPHEPISVSTPIVDSEAKETYIADRREPGTRQIELSPAIEKRRLEAKIRFLESQLQSDRPYSQLYKLGAGSLFVAIVSLAFWALTGIGAPFHPIFAAVVIPVAIGVIVMAFLVRHDKRQGKPSEKNIQPV